MKKSILTLCLLVQVLFLWAQNQYYVAPDGNDSHDGSLQKPFRTIERAQLKARKLKAKQPSICVKVSIGWSVL